MNKKIIKITLCFLLPVIIFATGKKPVYCTGADKASGSINNAAGVDVTGNTIGNIFTSEEGIVYKTTEGTNECQVVSYTGNSRNVIIPDEFNN